MNEKKRIEKVFNSLLDALQIPKHGVDGYEVEDMVHHAFHRGMELQRELTARKLGLLEDFEGIYDEQF